MPYLCECNCGQETVVGQRGKQNRFVHGHNLQLNRGESWTAEKALAYKKDWDKRNPERVLEIRRKTYYKRRDEILEGMRTPEAKEKRNARIRERYNTDPEYRRRCLAKRAARFLGIPKDERDAFRAMYDEDCFYCGEAGGTVDHLIPRSHGGADRLYNLVPCCATCNSSKGAKTPEEWYGFKVQQSESARPSVG